MFIFKDTAWLGGKHDGYPLLPFKDYMRTRHNASYSLQERAALVQSEFTFGLLEAVMEVKIPESVLLRVDSSSGTQVVTSENLPALLEDWRYRVSELGDGEPCLEWFNRVQTTFSQVRGRLSVEMLKPRYGCLQLAGLEPRELADIILQIGSVFEAANVSSRAFPRRFPRQGFSCSFITAMASDTHVTDLLIANGWCPFTYGIVSEGVCMLGYALTCKRPHIRESSEGHGKCTTESCVRNTIDTSNFVAKHVEETCNCDNFKPSLENVVGFLRTGKIPVVQCPPPHNELLVSDSLNTPYVAISHVWADGLRSTTEEGLPACQIKRLAAMTSQLVPGGAFWIDTLCIPAIQDVRNRAIGLMAQTYRDAAAVLVIDSGIRATSSSAAREEKLLHVLASGWMQRLWTLQEGLLALKLIFEFSDGLVAVDELLPVLAREDNFNTLLVQLSAEVFRLTKLRRPGASSSNFGISDVASFLGWRATSDARDETLAISGLLNLDAFELANIKSDQRMETFLLRIHHVPRDIIMLPGSKLNKAGFRWAPKTLMLGRTSSLRFGEQEAFCTSTGLLADYTALYFQDTVINGEDMWCIRDVLKGRIYKVSSDPSAGPDFSYTCNTLLLTERPKNSCANVCAAVLTIGKVSAADGGDRILCEFKKRLYVLDIIENELSKGKVIQTIVNGKSGKMRVKVV